MTRRVSVVPHTHWDREWYESFPRLRHRLVDLLDRVLPRLRDDPGAGTFLLDGQLAVVDDYLRVRPERTELVRSLAAAGRLEVGPWYVLMDEYLVSGETIVRNLQLGQRTAASLGGASEIGYLPDMFGHIAQMPQILRLAGMVHAVVWRGVPSAVDRTAFWWRAPDGSTVRAEYLPSGYGIGAHLPATPEDLVRRVEAEVAAAAPLLRPGDPLLLMNGSDHLEPPEHLAELVAKANAIGSDLELHLDTLAGYLASAPTGSLPSWQGELRSGARANLLMGVVSNRVDVRAAAAGAESALERRAEPLAALWQAAAAWPAGALDLAWRQVVLNAAHDSVCACSADEVVASVLHRYSEGAATADEVAGDALAAAAAAGAVPGPTALNPSPRTRSGVVEIIVPGAAAAEVAAAGARAVAGVVGSGAHVVAGVVGSGSHVAAGVVGSGGQVVTTTPAGTTTVDGSGADLGRLLGRLTADGWLPDGHPTTASVQVGPGGVEVTLGVDASAPRARSRGAVDGTATPVGARRSGADGTDAVMAEIAALAAGQRHQPLSITVVRAASTHLAVRVADVPGFGWAPARACPTTTVVTAGEHSMANGLVRLDVDANDGTWSLDGIAGLHRLVDDGDEGDTYNYSPPPVDVVVDRPDAVTVGIVESGPVRARLRVTRHFTWPAAVVEGRRVGAEEVDVVDVIELRAGEGFVRVSTTWPNRSRDHRLRSWLPLGVTATGSEAGCAFASVRRGLNAEGGPTERGLATYPARRWVRAGRLTFSTDGVVEYEVVDGGRALAVTLLRATGYLSRPAPTYRPNAAGPPLAVEGPQLAGPRRALYAVGVDVTDPWAMADDAWVPLEVVAARGGGRLPSSGSHLEVSGAEVSSLRREGRHLELRVFNPADTAAVVRVAGRRGWLVDLRGRCLQQWEGSFVLRAWGIATARIDDDTH